MYIPINKVINEKELFFKNNKIKIRESELRKIIKESINEILSSFPNQYDIAKLCADNIFDMVKNNEDNRIIDTNDNYIKKIDIRIVQLLMNGQFVGLNKDESKLYIEIGQNKLKKCDYKGLIDIIAHELMHGNVYLNKFDNTGSFDDDIPEYYNKLFDIMENNNGKISYFFAHALYSTYYQETNALVSQIYTSLDELIPNDKIITVNEFVNYFKKTNTYDEFNTILDKTLPIIERMSDISIETFIIKPFKQGNTNIDIKFVKEQCKKIRKISNETINKCYKNASLYFNKLKEEGRIKQIKR